MTGKPQRFCSRGHDKDATGRGAKGDCLKCRALSQAKWRANNERTDKGTQYPRTPADGTKRVHVPNGPPSPKRASTQPADMTSGDLYGDNFHLLHMEHPKNLAQADAARDRSDRLQEQREARARLRKESSK